MKAAIYAKVRVAIMKIACNGDIGTFGSPIFRSGVADLNKVGMTDASLLRIN